MNRGDLIAEIDPRDYENQLAEAKARLQDMEARATGAESNLGLTSTVTNAVLMQSGAALDASRDQVEVLKARLAQEEAAVRAAEAGFQQAAAKQAAASAEARRAADDAVRYRALYQKEEVSRQLLDRTETDARSSEANLEAAKQIVAAAQVQLAQARAGHAASLASLSLAGKQERQAEGMVGNLTPYESIYWQRMAGFTAALTPLSGAPQAAQQAHGLMYSLVQQQASYQAFMAVFGWSAVLTATVVLAPLLMEKVVLSGEVHMH